VAVEGASAESLNLYISQASGTKLDALYRAAWHAGLKTTYYLRSRSATHAEKSTMKRTDGKLNAVSLDAVADMPLPMAVVTGHWGLFLMQWQSRTTNAKSG
jgi:ribonucleoside-diphosphate reductase alpha chain